MRLLIDGDACPDKQEIKELAIKYQIEMYVYIDYAHELEDDYYHVIACEVGNDSVDMAIVHDAKKGDLIITQDYGLASYLLCKDVKVLHISGEEINNNNIDKFLFSRYVSGQIRRSIKHLKGPSKRTKEDKIRFLSKLEMMLKE